MVDIEYRLVRVISAHHPGLLAHCPRSLDLTGPPVRTPFYLDSSPRAETDRPLHSSSASIHDMNDDVLAAHDWVRSSLNSLVAKEGETIIDGSKIAATGDSAGGYLVNQLVRSLACLLCTCLVG